MPAEDLGQTGRAAIYEVADTDLAVGSTLGGPRATVVIKANGAIEKVFDPTTGAVVLGTLMLRHYDGVTGMYLGQSRPGTFTIHPEHQEHHYSLSNGVAVHETIFVLNGHTCGGALDPPGVYQLVELCNESDEPVELLTYAFIMLRGDTDHDVEATYDRRLGALLAWNRSRPRGHQSRGPACRIIGCSTPPESYQVTLDFGMAVSEHCPGRLSNQVEDVPVEPLGVLQHRFPLQPGEQVSAYYLLSFGPGRAGARRHYRACPDACEALARTKEHYHELLGRSVVLTPDPYVNQGVLWAKANMLRVETKAPTGWCFTNDPTRSNNSVARDTAWFAYGGDYFTPEFVRDSLLAYVRLQEKNGKVVEYYDIRTGKTEDYGLNINDNTPLLITGLWHHYSTTGDRDFLREVYPAAARAARYILSQRNDQGLVWCTATGTQDWGIAGWRNVIPQYRLSGATTELNSECYAALHTVSRMARALDRHDESQEFACAANDLRHAINTHLYNRENGLYYLNIDLDGNARSDVTCDLVFPVIFGVASEHTAAAIISRLSNHDFWTEAGIRTLPRDAPNYTPDQGWGLLGGVWVGVSFWYAFAAADHAPAFMAHALSASFRNYASDPRQHNTVPGQFSEWLHGETLVNQGMMLSPWFPPRYLWAAVEGMAGLNVAEDSLCLTPRLAPDWKWMAVQNLPYRDRRLTWFAACVPELRLYTTFHVSGENGAALSYDEDITGQVRVSGDAVCAIGLRQADNLMLFAGNTSDRTETASVSVQGDLPGRYRLRTYDSMMGEWSEGDELIPGQEIARGLTVHLEQKGFCLLDVRQEV